MADIINTTKRDFKYNGPVNSSDYNLRIEQNYNDLVYLYNKAKSIDVKLASAFERVIKDNIFLSNAIVDLENRVSDLESQENKISLASFSQLDYSSFVDTSFAISGADLLYFDPIYNFITLPKVRSSSYSHIKVGKSGNGQIVPDYFKARVDVSFPGVDSNAAVVESTPIYNSFLDSSDKLWYRNIIADTPSAAGAQMMLYIQVPLQVSGATKSNCIKLNPYPFFGTDIVLIEYTTKQNPTLTQSDGWIPLNSTGLYDGVAEAIGRVAPGGWENSGSDAIRNSPPLIFYFPEKDITAIRIKFIQRNYIYESPKYVYTYGLSDMDIRFDKFVPSGKTIIKYTPKNGDLISEVLNVTPKIYNIPLSLMDEAFSYRVLYSNGSAFSTSNPGSSTSVWIEVTLSMLDDNTAPILTDLVIDYEAV
jgi:hypothetical protein